MLKPVAAVGGALALAGAGAIGAVSLMENFVIAGIKGVDACDENPVGQVGPFKSTLSFQCTDGSSVLTSAGLSVDAQYESFRAPADLESVETGLFWPLFPNRNQYGQAEAFKAFPDGAPQTAEFESCEKSWDGAGSAGVTTFETLLLSSEEVVVNKTIEQQQIIAGGNAALKAGIDNLGVSANYFQASGNGIVQVCEVIANLVDTTSALGLVSQCANVVDYAPVPTTDESGAFRELILAEIGADAKSLVELILEWNSTGLTDGFLLGPGTEAIVSLISDDTVGLAVICQKATLGGLATNTGGDAPTAAGAYPTLSLTPDVCTTTYGVGGLAEASLRAQVEQGVLAALVSGITGVADITDLSDETQLAQLVAKCNDQEEDLSAIETAQILLPAGAAAAGVAAILLFVAVATAKAPLVLAGGVLGLVGGVLTLVALLGVRNAPVYANVGGVVEDGDVEYKSGLGATLGLAGIGAPVVGGLLGIGSFFCGTGEEGGALSSKVDNTY